MPEAKPTSPEPNEGEGTGTLPTSPSEKIFQPPNDGSWVPRARLNSVLEKQSLLEEQVKGLKKEQEPSREKLLQGVEQGEISQAAADAIWERSITDRVIEKVTGTVDASQKVKDQQRLFQDYESAIPALSDPSSTEYKKASTEYNYLVDTAGQPEGWGTIIMSVRSAFGPIEALKTKLAATVVHETHQEIGGAGGGPKQKGSSRQSQLTDRQKDYYTNAMKAGAYSNWDEVYDELGIKKDDAGKK